MLWQEKNVEEEKEKLVEENSHTALGSIDRGMFGSSLFFLCVFLSLFVDLFICTSLTRFSSVSPKSHSFKKKKKKKIFYNIDQPFLWLYLCLLALFTATLGVGLDLCILGWFLLFLFFLLFLMHVRLFFSLGLLRIRDLLYEQVEEWVVLSLVVWCGWLWLLASFGSLVLLFAPQAQGSGIPQMKAILSGVMFLSVCLSVFVCFHYCVFSYRSFLLSLCRYLFVSLSVFHYSMGILYQFQTPYISLPISLPSHTRNIFLSIFLSIYLSLFFFKVKFLSTLFTSSSGLIVGKEGCVFPFHKFVSCLLLLLLLLLLSTFLLFSFSPFVHMSALVAWVRSLFSHTHKT